MGNIVSLCATFAKARAEIRRLNTMVDLTKAVLDTAVGHAEIQGESIIATPATVTAGIQAKAQAMIGLFAHGGIQKYIHYTVA